MPADLRIQTVLSIVPRFIQLLVHLFWIWVTLGRKVRKARRAFERELIRQGISREDAERLSKQIETLKDQLMSSIWRFASK